MFNGVPKYCLSPKSGIITFQDRIIDMLTKIKNERNEMTRAENLVGDFVLENPHLVVNSYLAALAKQIGVSEPTVIRFCRRLGCSGFQDFKLRLAQSNVLDRSELFYSVTSNDAVEVLSAKIIDGATGSLNQLRNDLEYKSVGLAITALAEAEHIEFYGLGGSGIVAQDAQQKFLRLGKHVVAYVDPHLHVVAAGLLTENDVVVAISHTGCSRDLLISVEFARKAGATIITLTQSRSPLSLLADINISIDIDKHTDHYAPIRSRLSQLALLDILAVGVAVGGGAEVFDLLSTSNNRLADKFVSNCPQEECEDQ